MSEATSTQDPVGANISITKPLQSLSLIQSSDEILNAPTENGSIAAQQESLDQRPGVHRYLIAVEYIGTGFSGVQQQQHKCRTVGGVLEDAFQRFIGQPVSIACSSRTDTGVHALSNVFHVDVQRASKRRPGEVLPPYEPDVVKKAVNHFLQKNEGDLSLIDVRLVSGNFHARFNAKERTYFYRLLYGPGHISKFEKERAWHVHRELDISSMQKACQVLIGTHDFSSFRAAGCQANSPVRTLDELSVTEVSPSMYFPTIQEREQGVFPKDGGGRFLCNSFDVPRDIDVQKCQSRQNFGLRKTHSCCVITARGRSFLYHQVRLLVGVLKCVGTGHLTVLDGTACRSFILIIRRAISSKIVNAIQPKYSHFITVERILKAKDVTVASPMAPACGLYLGSVGYDLSEDNIQ